MSRFNQVVLCCTASILLSGYSFAKESDANASYFSPSIPADFGRPSLLHLKKVDDFSDFFKEGSPDLNFRLRYEQVSQDSSLRSANALTLRTLFGFQTAKFHGIDGRLQLINVSTPDYNTYNSTTNGNTTYSVIADPRNTAVNQGYVGFSGIPSSYLKAGRQVIVLDDQRFLGGGLFRQTMQNFDAASFTNQSLDHTTLFFAYLGDVNTAFTTQIPSDTYLFNAKYNGLQYVDITSYAYLVDEYGSYANSLNSTNTFGVRLTKDLQPHQVKYSYVAEYANQHSADNNPLNFDAYYFHVGAGFVWSLLSFNLDQEILSGDSSSINNVAFRTPLATKHLFQGWTDTFLTIPAAGMDDLFGTLGVTIPKLSDTRLQTIYHYFEAQSGSQLFGTEWDLGIFKKICKRYDLSLEYANFKTKNIAYPSTVKWWATASVDLA